jgi:predicted HTH transcriptional regulator
MTEQEFAELLARGHETQGIEFKGPGSRDDRHFFAKVTRAILGMANRRDGGLVIIGVEDDDGAPVPLGLTQEQLESWRFDDVAALLVTYADPTISFDLDVLEYQGTRFLVIKVHEFEDIPVLCNKDHDHGPGSNDKVLRKGACYVRSRRKPETSEIPSQEDMRELLDLAIDKGVRNFVTRAYRIGFLPAEQQEESSIDSTLFDRQLEDLV